MAATRLANATFVPRSPPAVRPDGCPASARRPGLPRATSPQLGALGWQALRDFAMPPAPVPLLLLLLRHAALRQYLDTAAGLLGTAGAVQPVERLEPELVGLSAAAQTRPTPWDLLQRTLPDEGPVGAFLDGAKQRLHAPDFADFWSLVRSNWRHSPPQALDFAAREVLDLAAYRLDAWVTSLAHFRLDADPARRPRRRHRAGRVRMGGRRACRSRSARLRGLRPRAVAGACDDRRGVCARDT